MRIEKSLSSLQQRLRRAREALQIVEEQLAYQVDVVEEAKVRMVVSETPLADREYRIARQDLVKLERERERARREIEALRAEQDRLLDRLSAGGR